MKMIDTMEDFRKIDTMKSKSDVTKKTMAMVATRKATQT